MGNIMLDCDGSIPTVGSHLGMGCTLLLQCL